MERILRFYLNFAIKRPWLVVVPVFILTAITSVWLVTAKPLRLDTNFTTLLPDEMPCVVESRRVSSLIGSTDYLIVAIESPVVEDNIAFADEVAERLKSFEELEYISTKQEKSYFRDRILYYLDKEDLEEVVGRAKARLDYEKTIRNPFYVSLDDEKPPDIGFDDIMEKYRERLRRRGAVGVVKDKKSEEEKGPSLGDRLAAEGGKIVSVIARPVKPALDMDFGRALVDKTQKLVDELNPKRNPDMRVQIGGPYRNRYNEYESVVGDIFSSLGVSISLILLLITVYFRRVRTVALIFVPLIVAIILTVGLTALTLERLNMTTALIFAVILGLGIDFGVHMSVRYLDERARKKSLEDSLSLSVIKTGKAILTAGLTTAGGLAVLILAEFKGFSEFGIIATMGISICLAVYTVLLPAMAVLMERVSKPKPWRKNLGSSAVRSGKSSVSTRRLGLGLAVVAAIAAAGFIFISQVEFEYDFRNLRSEKVGDSIKWGKTLGQGSSPVVAVLPDPSDAEALTRHLDEIADNDVEEKDLVKSSFSLFSFVPENQEQKMPLLEELRGYVDKALRLKKLKKETKEDLEEIRDLTLAGPVKTEEIPEWVKNKFREKDGTLGRMVYIYPRANEWVITQIGRFYDEYGTIDVPGKGTIRPSASGFIMVEVVRAVQRDGLLMTIVATSVVLLLLLVDLRSFKRALLVFSPLVVGAAWTIGTMALFDIKIGLYNMLVLPTMLGIGVDASVHLYHSYKEHGPGSLGYVMRTTGAAVAIAAATTAVGFTGMLVVSHAGLRSIGILALIGIGATLLGALITMPLELAFLEGRGRRKKTT